MAENDTSRSNETLLGLLDDSLDAEETERLARARKHAQEVLDDVEHAPKTGPLQRDLNDNESLLAWAVDYQADVIEGLRGALKAFTMSETRDTVSGNGDDEVQAKLRAAVRAAFEHGVCVKARFTTRGDKWRIKHAEAIEIALNHKDAKNV